MVIVSAGWLFSKDVTAWLITVLAGLGPVVTSHMVTLVPPALPVEEALPLPAAEPHAASATVSAAAAVTASHRGRRCRLIYACWASHSSWRRQGGSKHLENISKMFAILESGWRPVNP